MVSDRFPYNHPPRPVHTGATATEGQELRRVTASGITSKSARPRLRLADEFVRATVTTIIVIVIIQRLD